MKKIYVFVLAVLSASFSSWSQKVWDGPATGGSWATAANWNNNTLPVAGDVVQFGAGISGTISNVPTISLSGLIISDGASITFTQPGAGANTITITNGTAAVDFSITAGSSLSLASNVNVTLNTGSAGNLTTAAIAGSLFLSGIYNTNASNLITNVLSTGVIQVNGTGAAVSNAISKFAFASGAVYIHARNAGTIPTATWDAASKTSITGVTDAAPTGFTADQSFGDFEWNSTQTGQVSLNGGLRSIQGDLSIIKTSTTATPYALILTSTTDRILNIGGDLNIEESGTDSTTVYFTGGGNGDMTINVTGNYNHEGGSVVFAFPDTDNDNGVAILNLTGNFSQTGGDIDFTSTIDDISGSAGQKGTMTIKGNFIQTGGTIRSTTLNPDIPNGLINFNNAGLQTFNATTPTNITYINYQVSNGSVLKLASGLRITRDSVSIFPNWVGKFTVNPGGTLDASTFVIQSQVLPDLVAPGGATANFTLMPDSKLITANADGIAGSVDTTNNLLASFSSGADYEFQGASTGSFVTTPLPNTLRNLIVNRTGTLVLDMPVTLTDGQLSLTNGLLTTTTTNLLTIGPGSSTTPATATSFVNGPLAKIGATDFTFPVGKAGAGFRNIGIVAPSASSTFRAEFFSAESPAGTLAPTLVRVSSCEYWDLSRTAGTGSARVVLSWELASRCNGAYVTDPTTLRVAHLLGGIWEDEGRLSSTGTNTAGTITSGDIVATFSPFALASSDAGSNPLPVVFVDVKAYENNSGVQIEWSNLTERDVVEYSIERSANGTDFETILTQWPTSNQDNRANYSVFDANPIKSSNYYRIKVIETTGKIVYSKILSVNIDRNAFGLTLYPNPVKDLQVTIALSNMKRGRYNLRVVSATGQDVFRKTILNQSNSFTQTFSLPSSVRPGVYNMIITADGYRETKMFIVQ